MTRSVARASAAILCFLMSATLAAAEPKEAVLRVWISSTFDLHVKMADDWEQLTQEGTARLRNTDTLRITSAKPKQFVLNIAARPTYSTTYRDPGNLREHVAVWHQKNGAGKLLPLIGPNVHGWYYALKPGSVRNPDYTDGYEGYVMVNELLPVQFKLRYNPDTRATAAKALEAIRTAHGN